MSDRTPVEFAAWPTPIENDRLELVELTYRGLGRIVELPPEGVRLEVEPVRSMGPELFAIFLSLDSHLLYRVSVEVPGAFRVLDEHGLTELWSADQARRPANTTFRVRNHGWSRESDLSFFMGADDGYSYLVATDWDCLEIICRDPPVVEVVGEAVKRPLRSVGAEPGDNPEWLGRLLGKGSPIDRRGRWDDLGP